MKNDIEKLKYPIGKFQAPEHISKEQIDKWVEIIETFPQRLNTEIQNLTEKELEKQYRPGGWTVRQVVHHCADSHMNSFIRFKLALTEETPTIKPYFENLWAELPDAKLLPIESSIHLLNGLHTRWVILLKHLTERELKKTFKHPETNKFISLETNIAIYAWHCNHHLAHVINAKM